MTINEQHIGRTTTKTKTMEQRELKFRSAHYNHDGTFNGFTYWGLLDVFDRHTSDCFASPTWRYGTIRKVEEQYTGLKDKNGKEIYEGDIVQTIDNELSPGKYLIHWREDVYMMVGTGGPGEWLSMEEFEGCELIGNIHQNPELLKGDQQNG